MDPIRTREELEALYDHHVNMLWLMFKGTRRAVKCPGVPIAIGERFIHRKQLSI